MRHLICLVLVFEVVVGLRKGKRGRAGEPAIQAASVPDPSGHWSAKVSSSLFNSKGLSLALPGGKKAYFDCHTGMGLASAAGSGISAMHGSDGLSQISAVTDKSGVIAGSVVDPEAGMVHQFSGEEGGELSFLSTPSDNFPEEGEPLADSEAPFDVDVAAAAEMDGEDAEEGLAGDDAAHASAAESVMGVMVVWTKHAECRNAGRARGCRLTASTRSRMAARINLAVEETNKGYKSSQVQAQLRLVHSRREDRYSEATSDAFGKALNAVTSTSDGNMDEVHAERKKYGADLVALIIDDPKLCGLAWLGPRKSRMFSVTAWNCATGYYSFGHEIGHNLGCNHDLGTKNACKGSKYNYGYRDPKARFRTIMGYSCKTGQCDKMPKNGCTRVNWWSNPSVTYNGMTTGIRNKADNARQINDVRATVAKYY